MKHPSAKPSPSMSPTPSAADTLERRYQRAKKVFAKALARLMQVLDKSPQDFVKTYREGILESLLEENPHMSIAELSLRSGMDRRHVSAYLHGERMAGQTKRNKLVVILSELGRVAARHYPDGKIPRKGPAPSFDSVCNRYAKGEYSPAAVLKELQRRGAVEDHGDNVLLISKTFVRGENAIDIFSFVTNTFSMLVETSLTNLEIENFTDRLAQRIIYSTQISPEKRAEVQQEVKSLMEKHYREYRQLLESHELPVAAGTFDPVGVSLFQFAPLSAEADSRRWGEDEA